MHNRMTWNPVDPAPFESAWSVFAKLIALNFYKPLDIARIIERPGTHSRRGLEFRDSTWINFERFAEMIYVDPQRLRIGFLDQLGFPKLSEGNGRLGIRFCSECWKSGYHCILFELAIVAECPIHRLPLEERCNVCSIAIGWEGLIYKKGRIKSDECQANGRLYVYHSKCKHIVFDPNRISENPRLELTQLQDMRIACERFIEWWQRAVGSANAKSGLIETLALGSFDKSDRSALGLTLDVATRTAGVCPWTTVISCSPATWLAFKKNRSEDLSGCGVEFNSALGRVYRSIRRHIFRKYLRPSHANCWCEMVKYSSIMSRAICSQRACAVTLAFMSWRMSLEGFSNIEVFRLGNSRKPVILPVGLAVNSSFEIANFWYAQFFAILGKIQEKMVKGVHFYISRVSGQAWFAGNAFYHPIESNDNEDRVWWLSYQNRLHVMSFVNARCRERMRRSKSILSPVNLIIENRRVGDGSPFNYNKTDILFLIRDDNLLKRIYECISL